MENIINWILFFGDGEAHDDVKITDLPAAPPWRRFKHSQDTTKEIEERWDEIQTLANSEQNKRGRLKGEKFRLLTKNKSDREYGEKAKKVIDAVNAAIYLRRPLLVTGIPGSGKTSLAYAIAHQLKLGPVLTWAISSRSTVQDGLYRYDAIARLQETKKEGDKDRKGENDIGDYLRLGSVGTAFLPSKHPRVLLIDEIDKSDIDLPNDLLHLFEEGTFEIPELIRWIKRNSDQKDPDTTVNIRTQDNGIKVRTTGIVHCTEFPIVIMTSNGERDFPPAFMRRCLQVDMPKPNLELLKDIVKSHFDDSDDPELFNKVTDVTEKLIEDFLSEKGLAIDQLLNAIYVRANVNNTFLDDKELKELLLKRLSTQYESK